MPCLKIATISSTFKLNKLFEPNETNSKKKRVRVSERKTALSPRKNFVPRKFWNS